MTHRKWPVAVAVLIVLVGVGAFVALGGDGSASATTAVSPARGGPGRASGASSAPASESAAERPRAWEPGAQFGYALSLEQLVVFGEPARKASTMRLALEGSLTQTVVGGRPDQVDVQLQLVPARLDFESDGRDALDVESRSRMLALLGAPFYVTYNRQGAALSVFFERGMGPIEQNFLRSLVASTQFVVSGTPPATWDAQELDTTGQYVARYQRKPGDRQYAKTKERYLQLASEKGLRPIGEAVQIELTGGSTAALGPEGWPQELMGSERLRMTFGEQLEPISAQARFALQRTSTRNVPLLIGALDARRAQLVRSPLAVQVFTPQDPQMGLKQLVDGANLADLVHELRNVRGAPSAGSRSARLLNRMSALFQLEPESAKAVPSLLQREKERDLYSPVLGALSAASTPQAVHALAKVAMDAETQQPTRVNAVAMLGMAPTPTPEGTEALRGLARGGDVELRDTAALALGNVARNAGNTDAAAAAELVRELQDLARTASTPQAKAMWIRSLANSADARILPFLQECLSDPLPLIRQAAVEAMRLVRAPLADELLVERLVRDGSSDVRRSAIFAASFRPIEPLLVALGQVLRTDGVDAVRMDAVRLLGANVLQVPLARELLTWSGQNDRNGEIRHTATAFLVAPTRSTGEPTRP